jgi:hypothetical protein
MDFPGTISLAAFPPTRLFIGIVAELAFRFKKVFVRRCPTGLFATTHAQNPTSVTRLPEGRLNGL